MPCEHAEITTTVLKLIKSCTYGMKTERKFGILTTSTAFTFSHIKFQGFRSVKICFHRATGQPYNNYLKFLHTIYKHWLFYKETDLRVGRADLYTG